MNTSEMFGKDDSQRNWNEIERTSNSEKVDVEIIKKNSPTSLGFFKKERSERSFKPLDERYSSVTGKVLRPGSVKNEVLSCTENCYYLVQVPDSSCNVSETFICSEVGVLPTNLIRSARDKNCEGMKSLSLVKFCAETGEARKFTVINLPARSNFSNHPEQRVGCEPDLKDEEIKNGQEFMSSKVDGLAVKNQCIEGGNDGERQGCSEPKDEEVACRICHSVTTHDQEPLVSPCLCTGSVKFVHESCLMNWLKSSVKTRCELCLHRLQVVKTLKPLNEWRLPGEKPVAIIWLVTFLIALILNISSIIKDASRSCTTTPCIVFYILGTMGVVFGLIFLAFWVIKSAAFLKKWLAFNQVWRLKDKYLDSSGMSKRSTANCVAQV